LSLLFYELWLAGFVLFWALDVRLARRRTGQDPGTFPARILKSLKNALPLILPYLAWLVWFKTTYKQPAHQPVFSVVRALRTSLSIHFRLYHWITDTPWSTAVRDGWKAMWSPLGVLLWLLLAVAITLVVSATRRTIATTPKEDHPSLADELLFAWGIFLASRLVFIFQGAVSSSTRHSYGAAMAAAVAGSSLFERLLAALAGRPIAQWALRAVAGSTFVFLALTSAGISVHYRETSRAEQKTYEQLVGHLQSAKTIIVLGTPTRTAGELAYFSEDSGVWLQNRLRSVQSGINAYVVSDAKVDGSGISVRVSDRRPGVSYTLGTVELRLPWQNVSVFKWDRGALVAVIAYN
jgi:hypothetical protein